MSGLETGRCCRHWRNGLGICRSTGYSRLSSCQSFKWSDNCRNLWGTLALARAGILDTVAHTSNSADFLQQKAVGYEGRSLYRNSPAAVVADRIITAPGAAPVSFTCAVFESAGLSSEIISQFRSMLAAEHG